MCFSAQASFGAAAALAAIGVLSLRGVTARDQIPLAAVPLLFAAQQASEGALWLVLGSAPSGKSDTPIAQVFLFFAVFVWPAYLAFALRPLERDRTRRTVLALLSGAGAVLGLYLMGCATLRSSDACIAFDNLYYWVQIDVPMKPLAPFLYLSLVVGPMLVSTVRGTSVLALATVASFACAGWLYRAGFVSVWCFFAALLSGIVALMVRALGQTVRACRSSSLA